MRLLKQSFGAWLLISLLVFSAKGAQAEACIQIEFFPDVSFSIYHIAVTDGYGYTATPVFSRLFKNLDDFDVDDFRNLAASLPPFIRLSKILPKQSAVTDHEGKLCFWGLSPGLYLLTGESFFHQGKLYSPAGCIIAVEEDSTVPISIQPKYIPMPEQPPDTSDPANLETYWIGFATSILGIVILLRKRP